MDLKENLGSPINLFWSPMKICGSQRKSWVSNKKLGVSNDNPGVSNEKLGLSNEMVVMAAHYPYRNRALGLMLSFYKAETEYYPLYARFL